MRIALQLRTSRLQLVKDIKEVEAQARTTGHEGAEPVGASGAAAVGVRARRRAEYEGQYVPMCVAMHVSKDYAAAARLQDEMETPIKD